MGKRYKPLLLAILGLAAIWFLVILVILPQISNVPHWMPIISQEQNNLNTHSPKDSYNQAQPPHSLSYMNHFLPRHLGFSFAGTLFYQLKFKSNEAVNASIHKEEHEKSTLKLGTINNSVDHYIRSEGYKLFAFNLLVSNRIGLSRPLPDTRNEECLKRVRIAENTGPSGDMHNSKEDLTIKLQASIIICYYNEAPSALLRTISTILERSPSPNLKEIIVVDDYSNYEYNYNKIRAFISSSLVTLVRTSRREGLIRARMFGANLAKGDVLIFLDSHVEANVGWLEPLLEIVQANRTTVACPMIDLINPKTLIYSSSPMVKGGLNWALNFKWDSVPSNQLKTYVDFIKPIQSPTMAGGLYAIDRDYFFQLGNYDSGMELWGGENVEMSLRIWLCGGRILILPCSRLGHIFRKTRPYGPEPDQPDSLLINSHRTARVWLDEYIYKYYEANPDARYLNETDINARIDLRNRLKCQNFTYYLDKVYPILKNELDDVPESMIDLVNRPKLFNLPPKRVNRSIRWYNNELKSIGVINYRKQRQAMHRYGANPHIHLVRCRVLRLMMNNRSTNSEKFFNRWRRTLDC